MQFNSLDKFGFKVFCSEVQDGEMTLNTPEGTQNIKNYLDKIGASDPLCQMHQVHGVNIVQAEKPALYTDADGLISAKRLTLAVKTADCVPIAFVCVKTGFFGIIHAGRKGLTEGIISTSLKQQLRKHRLQSANIRVFLGPHIRRSSYPLSEKVFNSLKCTSWSRYIFGEENNFDLTLATLDELVKIGVLKENINDCGIDTYRDLRFFSARRSPDNENIRFLTVIFHD